MSRTNRLITVTLIASMAIGGVALGMEGNTRYQTGVTLQKILQGAEKVAPKTSLDEYQKSQKDTQKIQLEKQKQEIYAWYKNQKKIIQTDAELARKSYTEMTMGMTETEKLSQKDALYAQYKQIAIDTEARLQELKTQKESKLRAIEQQYVGVKNTDNQAKNESATLLDSRKKELNTWYETQKKQLMTSFEEQKAYLYSKRNELSEEEKKSQQALFDEKKKAIQVELEMKKKDLQSQFEAKMKEIKSQYGILESGQKEKVLGSTDKDKMKQELKDKLSKLVSEKKTTSSDGAQCKAGFETLRVAKEANAKERKTAWDNFWEANKGTKKDLFTEDSREDVKDTLDAMRLQIRLVERKYVKSLVGTSSTVTLEYALSTIDTITQRTRTDLADYVQDGKTTQFNAFRDGFISVLNTNKRSLLTLLQSQAQTIKGFTEVCKKKALATLIIQDQSDRQTQGLLNSNVNGTSVRGSNESKKEPLKSEKKSLDKESSTQ